MEEVLTVAQLIEQLQKFPPDAKVFFQAPPDSVADFEPIPQYGVRSADKPTGPWERSNSVVLES